GRGLCARQDVLVVEDVEALVLHCAHVEVRYGYDHEHVEVVFAAEGRLIPAHRALERVHRVAAAVFFAGLDIDAQRYLASGHRAKAILDEGEGSAHEREQIGGLRKRIVPDREVAIAAGQGPGVDEVAVGEKYRRIGDVSLDARRIDRHHVRSIGKIGD